MRSSFDSTCLLFGVLTIGWASGCTEAELGVTAQAETGTVCAFVTDTVGGQTITTPSIAVIVPDTAITTDPIRVHVDGTQQPSWDIASRRLVSITRSRARTCS